jgi:hypothetical protein
MLINEWYRVLHTLVMCRISVPQLQAEQNETRCPDERTRPPPVAIYVYLQDKTRRELKQDILKEKGKKEMTRKGFHEVARPA